MKIITDQHQKTSVQADNDHNEMIRVNQINEKLMAIQKRQLTDIDEQRESLKKIGLEKNNLEQELIRLNDDYTSSKDSCNHK